MEKVSLLFVYVCINTVFVICNCIATPTTSLIKNESAVLQEIVLPLVYFHKMAQLVTSLLTEIHLTNPLWFLAIESLTNKIIWKRPLRISAPLVGENLR